MAHAITMLGSNDPHRRETLQEEQQHEDFISLKLEPRASAPTQIKSRPISSSEVRKPKPTLGPSPAFLETNKNSKESALSKGPHTPRRAGVGLRGVSLHLSMPSREGIEEPNLSPASTQKVPQSPRLDTSSVYASPGSVLPRRSRGLDYTRACTNLHHSTIAEQSSPDSSPVIGGKGINIPRRGYAIGAAPDSPMFTTSNWPAANTSDAKTIVSSSVGSVNLIASGSDTDSSDDDMAADEEEDTIHMTPQAFKNNNVFGIMANASPVTDTMSPFSQAAASLMSFQRRTRRARSTRHSSSSASGRSSMPSPAPGSPPVLKSVDDRSSLSYFDRDMKSKSIASRRESLSLGTGDLKIDDSVDEDSGEHSSLSDALGLAINGSSSLDGRRNVIKRAVTRRSNLMPKPKTFARIRAALQEETSPVDAECKREAEVIKQVRESDNNNDTAVIASQPTTTVSSPSLMPAAGINTEGLEDLTDMMAGEAILNSRRGSSNRPNPSLRGPNGLELGSAFDNRVRTPPPPLFGRGSSSGVSEDISMDTPASSIYSLNQTRNSSPSRSTTPQPIQADTTRKALGKRRRDDDLDPYLLKRRAVSPGVSHQSSPVLPPSPAQREGSFWSSRSTGDGSQRSGSNGSTNTSGNVGKVVGMKGMNDTNDGLMNMTID